MLKSCKYCGRIHDSKIICHARPKQTKPQDDEAVQFRNTKLWQRHRDSIKERDMYLCQICLAEGIYNAEALEVHHIEPIHEAYDKRLDDDNTITLDTVHHKAADNGEIDRELLHRLARESRERYDHAREA